MSHNTSTHSAANESAALFTAALVLTLFGVLAGVESTGWGVTSTLFIMAAAACTGGFVIRYGGKN